MRLWVLEKRSSKKADKIWGYDCAYAFVVRASSEIAARKLAHANGGDENRSGESPWLNARLTSCEPLTARGKVGIIIESYLNG